MFQKEHDPVRVAVDLVNTWDLLEADPELLRDTATLKRFLARRNLSAASRATSRDLAEVRRLRGELRTAFEAADESAAVRALNAILGRTSAKPQFELDDGAWVLRWAGRVPDVLAAQAAMSLLEAIRDDGWERFGICAGAPCCCVFVDRSKNRSRRFCSELCADRVAQSLHRARVRRKPQRG
jgi:predicted RNA-binding Zn ribbon-like protein